METNRRGLVRKQLIFMELLVGFLIYVLVLGLFDDYTDLVSAKSFSTIVFLSKIVFLWALDAVFGGNFDVSGFVAMLVVIACVTVLARVANGFFVKLGAPADVLN